MIYGTAWKEDETEACVARALHAGFRAFDTANQRKHYHEQAVGDALAAWLAGGEGERAGLFVQTKFTYVSSQDERLPYDPQASFAEQVGQSFARSLEHLRTDYVDCYMLHGPSQWQGLGEADWETWRAMEALHDAGAARTLGVSNVDLDQLRTLCAGARVKPTHVQNRCFAHQRWDAPVRAFCREQGIVYQGFSLLTANRPVLQNPRLLEVALRLDATAAQVVFAFARQVGMLPLTGTRDRKHMSDDLASLAMQLAPDELALIEQIAQPND